jgi:hypothetical protein
VFAFCVKNGRFFYLMAAGFGIIFDMHIELKRTEMRLSGMGVQFTAGVAVSGRSAKLRG